MDDMGVLIVAIGLIAAGLAVGLVYLSLGGRRRRLRRERSLRNIANRKLWDRVFRRNVMLRLTDRRDLD